MEFVLAVSASPRVPLWRYRLRRLLRPRHVEVDGFRVLAYRPDIPSHIASLLIRGDYEAPERTAAKAVIRPEDRVLEIGACVGLVTLTAARIVGADRVLAFEPNVAAASVARENLAANGLPVTVVPHALGAAAGRLRLSIGADSWLGASGRLVYDGQIVEVAQDAIADVVERFRPTVLLIDAEGMEDEILVAAPMARLRAVIVEFHPAILGAKTLDRLRGLLTDRGLTLRRELTMETTEVFLRPSA